MVISSRCDAYWRAATFRLWHRVITVSRRVNQMSRRNLRCLRRLDFLSRRGWSGSRRGTLALLYLLVWKSGSRCLMVTFGGV